MTLSLEHNRQYFQHLRTAATLTENPRVGGSTPSLATNKYQYKRANLSRYAFYFLPLIGHNASSSPITNSHLDCPYMPRKKRSRYADYCETRNGDLYARVSVPIGGGKYKTKRKKVSTRIEARQWALGELDRTRHGNPGELQTFLDLCEWYKTYFLVAPVYEGNSKVEGTKDWQKSRNKLDRMAVFFGPKRLAVFSEQDLLAYSRDRRQKDKVTTSTINRDLALLRSMFRKGHEADRTINVPRFPINLSAETERNRVMTRAEEALILAACDAVEPLSYKRKGQSITAKHRTNREHLRAIIILAVDTAMRSGEIFSLTWDDIDLKAGVITIRSHNTKTQRERKVGITPRVKAELEAIKGKGKVFPIRSARKAFATACRRVGITDLHFHDLRHTATTRMIRAGIPHTEVMKITGHTQIKTFLRYLNLVDSTVQTTAEMLAAYLDSD
jgi:integrase